MRSGRANGSLVLPDIDLSIALVQAIRNEKECHALFWQKREIDIFQIGGCSIGANAMTAGIQSWAFVLAITVLCWPA